MLQVTRLAMWGVLVPTIVLCAFARDVHAQPYNYTIMGQIRTSTGSPDWLGCDRPVGWVWVKVREQGFLYDTTLAETWTLPDGSFSTTFTSSSTSLLINIMVRGVAWVPDGKFIYLRKNLDEIIYYARVEDLSRQCIPGTTILDPLHLSDNKCNVLTEAAKAIRYASSNQEAGMGWTVPADLDAYPNTGATQTAANGKYIEVAQEDWNVVTTAGGAHSNTHHEIGHWIAYHAYGGRWPPDAFTPPSHDWWTENCEGFAIREGWAEYFAHMSCPDYYSTLQDTDNYWRGQDTMGDSNINVTGMGDIVEGAIANTWVHLNDFGKVFRTLATAQPDSFWEFHGGWGNCGYSRAVLHPAAQSNGIILSRGKIDGFSEGAPPNAAPPDAGNQTTIRGVTYVRGTVHPTTSAVSKAALKLAEHAFTIGIDRKRLGYKIIGSPDDLSENRGSKPPPDGFPGFTFLPDVDWLAQTVFATGTLADGAYDLLLKTRNAYGWWDDFSPSFQGDADPDRDSDEKWLKHLRTWYNQDENPALNNGKDDKGKVMVDNTPPTISNTFPPASP